MHKSLLLIMAGIGLATTSVANATLYDFTFTDTISSASTPGISVGDVFTLHLFADNGGSTLISQIWNYSDLQGFTIQAGSYSASYSQVFPSPSTGNFVTDALGLVSAVQFYGTGNGSVNVDNFGSFGGDVVFGNLNFFDSQGRGNNIAAGGASNAGAWTVSLAGAVAPGVPEPASWALLVIGTGIVGANMRLRRKTATVAA